MRSYLAAFVGRNRAVGVATRYGRMVRGSNPVGARFSAPIQTGPGEQPASCTLGTGSLSRVKAAGALL
jgi:hypothetical protein